MQGHIQGADGVDHRAPPPVHGRAHIELLPERLDLQGILADQHLGEAQAHGVGAGGLDAGAGDPGIDIALPDARQPLIGMDLHDDIVLGGTGGAHVHVG